MKKFVITIGREYGSGGRIIGEKLAKRLGVNFYDKNMIDKILVSVDTNDILVLAKRIKLIEQIQNEFKFNLNKELILNKMILLWE